MSTFARLAGEVVRESAPLSIAPRDDFGRWWRRVHRHFDWRPLTAFPSLNLHLAFMATPASYATDRDVPPAAWLARKKVFEPTPLRFGLPDNFVSLSRWPRETRSLIQGLTDRRAVWTHFSHSYRAYFSRSGHESRRCKIRGVIVGRPRCRLDRRRFR